MKAGRAGIVRFLLRLPAALHLTLQAAARAAGVSLNEYCVRRLSAPATPLGLHEDAEALATRARALFHAELRGVVLLGSWARGEEAQDSDVDALVVVDENVRLTRTLYRRWDQTPIRWQGRTVDVHFVHLPVDETPGAGIWCEAAVDGIVLMDPDGAVTSWLIRVRQAIAAGRLLRRSLHGQPYWIEAA